jgi:signal transduction histidine kinase
VALSPGIDLTAYRIVQEALTNTIRHAQGAQVCVEISYEEGSVTVRVTDTGPGVTPDGATSGAAPSGAGGQKTPARLGPGFGLAGIAERVSSCGGTLTVGPAATGGFAVTAQLPLR